MRHMETANGGRNYCFSLQKREKFVQKVELRGNAHLHSMYNREFPGPAELRKGYERQEERGNIRKVITVRQRGMKESVKKRTIVLLIQMVYRYKPPLLTTTTHEQPTYLWKSSVVGWWTATCRHNERAVKRPAGAHDSASVVLATHMSYHRGLKSASQEEWWSTLHCATACDPAKKNKIKMVRLNWNRTHEGCFPVTQIRPVGLLCYWWYHRILN